WANNGLYLTTSTGLTTANFATTSISQWNNNSGYITTSSIIFGGITSSTFNVGSNLFMSATGTIGVTSTPIFSGDSTFNGRLAVGTTTFTGSVNIQSSTDSATGVAGIYEQLLINTSVGGTFQFGNRAIVTVSTTASTTAIGSFIRMIDNTTMANNVQALQVQAWSGSNNQGENTGISTAGRTFGIKAFTSGESGAVAQPAAVYAELQNGTQGNAIRAYSSTSTTATLVSFFQENSNFSGTGLLMNFGNTGGSFTGNFLNLQRASTTMFTINATGTVVIASSSVAAGASSTLTVCAQSNCTLSSTSTGSVAWFASVDGTTSTNSIVARGSIVGNAADFAEYVPVVGDTSNYEQGDLLSISSSTETFEKSRGSYDAGLMGAISEGAAFIGGIEGGTGGKVVMTLAGRIRINVSGENDTIKPGDPITASSERGVGMKAMQAGRVIGYALEAFEGTSATSTGKILVLVQPQWYAPQVTAEDLQGGSSGTGLTLNTYTFDPNTIYSFENLKVQHLEIGSSNKPSGITTYDVETKNPYCIIVENGVLKAMPGKCGEGSTTNIIATSTVTNSNSTAPISTTNDSTTTNATTDTTTTVPDTATTTDTTTSATDTTITDATTTTATTTDTTTTATTTDTTAPNVDSSTATTTAPAATATTTTTTESTTNTATSTTDSSTTTTDMAAESSSTPVISSSTTDATATEATITEATTTESTITTSSSEPAPEPVPEPAPEPTSPPEPEPTPDDSTNATST
ncbi:MAG: hypothetical protein Q8O66_00880, partial [bacterium]|nr:hypothetical protein [bacterium]